MKKLLKSDICWTMNSAVGSIDVIKVTGSIDVIKVTKNRKSAATVHEQ